MSIPNLLSLSRLPLAAALFACVAAGWWLVGLALFALALFTDWLDGFWARKYGPMTALGRNLDPLTDKVLICGAFIYLAEVPAAGVGPGLVTIVVGRELLVTGLRGMVEATGAKFGADWFGKLKTALQGAAILAILGQEALRAQEAGGELLQAASVTRQVLLVAMLVATVGSGVQYLVRAVRVFRGAKA